jgi:hypothetical protein
LVFRPIFEEAKQLGAETMNDQPTSPSSSIVAVPGVGSVNAERLAEMRASYVRAFVPKEGDSPEAIGLGRANRGLEFDNAIKAPAAGQFPTAFTAPVDQARIDRGYEAIRNFAGLGPKAFEELRNQTHATPEEHAIASAWRASAMKDSAFVKKYLDGDADATRLMLASNALLLKAIKPK